MSNQTNYGFYISKSLAIFLTAIYYFIFGSLMSITIDKCMKETSDKELKQLSTLQLIIDISVTFGVVGLGFYFLRIFIKSIPYPLDGFFGYEHSKLKEVSGGIIVSYVVYTYQNKLLKKILELKRRFDL